MAEPVGPKETRDTLERVLNTLAIRNSEGKFDYYSVSLSKTPRGTNGKFVDINRLPPVISEGYVYYKRNVYYISVREFLRRYVDVSKPPVDLAAFNQHYVPSSVDTGAASENKPGTNEDSGNISSEVIDLAWEEQISTLLHLDDTQEEW